MRFMMLIYPSEKAEAGQMPTQEEIQGMMSYNEELTKAGVLLALDGLHPSSQGARITFDGNKAKATDGPFTESKEIIGGYWMIQVKSKEEAVAWALKCPPFGAKKIELRRVFDMADFDIPANSELEAQVERVSASLTSKQ